MFPQFRTLKSTLIWARIICHKQQYRCPFFFCRLEEHECNHNKNGGKKSGSSIYVHPFQGRGNTGRRTATHASSGQWSYTRPRCTRLFIIRTFYCKQTFIIMLTNYQLLSDERIQSGTGPVRTGEPKVATVPQCPLPIGLNVCRCLNLKAKSSRRPDSCKTHFESQGPDT